MEAQNLTWPGHAPPETGQAPPRKLLLIMAAAAAPPSLPVLSCTQYVLHGTPRIVCNFTYIVIPRRYGTLRCLRESHSSFITHPLPFRADLRDPEGSSCHPPSPAVAGSFPSGPVPPPITRPSVIIRRDKHRSWRLRSERASLSYLCCHSESRGP